MCGIEVAMIHRPEQSGGWSLAMCQFGIAYDQCGEFKVTSDDI